MCSPSDQFHKEIPNVYRRGLGYSKMRKTKRPWSNLIFSWQNLIGRHFTLLFGSERQRNVQRFIKRVHSYCSAH